MTETPTLTDRVGLYELGLVLKPIANEIRKTQEFPSEPINWSLTPILFDNQLYFGVRLGTLFQDNTPETEEIIESVLNERAFFDCSIHTTSDRNVWGHNITGKKLSTLIKTISTAMKEISIISDSAQLWSIQETDETKNWFYIQTYFPISREELNRIGEAIRRYNASH